MINTDTQVGQKILLAFQGSTMPPHIAAWLTQRPVGGFTLFRYQNVENPAQVRELTAELQRTAAAHGHPHLLIAADQEAGQLMGLGDGLTPFPGNMALGATQSAQLAYKVGHALGQECAALGVNVDYAPSCDVNSNPLNPVIGVRSFGEDAAQVAELAAAMSRGLQDAGVVSAIKHFPGHGDTQTDSHHGIPVLPHDEKRLWDVELRPFQAAIAAGAKIVMSAHIAIPVLNNGRNIPATLSRTILQDLLRSQLGFQGVIVSDAMDMQAIQQGSAMAADIVAAALAGIDLFLMTNDPAAQELAHETLRTSLERGYIPRDAHQRSIQRILALQQWAAAQPQPDLTIIQCDAHRQLARQVAEQSITLVRDDAHQLPLRLPAEARVLVITPEFITLTPADTSATEKQTLGQMLRRYHPYVDEYVVPQRPCESTIATFRQRIQEYDLVIIGSIEASRQPEQAALINAVHQTGVPLITIALRTPYDLAAYPDVPTHICTYSIQPPAMQALAAALFGQISFMGKLPTQIPGLYPLGHAAHTR